MVIKKNRKTLLFGITQRIIRKRKKNLLWDVYQQWYFLFTNISVPYEIKYFSKTPSTTIIQIKRSIDITPANNWKHTIPSLIQGGQDFS